LKTKNIYLVAFYYEKPRPGVNTAIAGWRNDPNNIRYDERVEISNRLKHDAGSAKIIMNLTNKTVERNAWNDNRDFNELFKYFFKGYHQYVTQVMTQLDAEYFNKMLDEMQTEWDVEEKKNETLQAQ
jgi:hypothetical protein